MAPTLSVVTVVLNDKAGLQRTADSLAAQEWRDFEWLVVDGSSSDGTRQILATLDPQPSEYVSEKDRGTYDAMNKGLSMCRGEWVLFLNAGDWLCNERTLTDVAGWLDDSKSDWGFGAVRNIDANGIATGLQCASPFTVEGLAIGQTTVPHQATFMRRQLLNDLGGFLVDFGTEADQELVYRAALRGRPFEMVWPVANFPVGGQGMNQRTGHFARAMKKARKRQGMPLFGSTVLDAVATEALVAKEHLKSAEVAITHKLAR
jgi:GT2 family glycosyltransferase